MDTLSNQPPVADRLALTYEQLAADIAASLPQVLPTIASDADIVKARAIIKPMMALQDKAERARKQEKDYYLQGGRSVDTFFKGLTANLDRIVAIISSTAAIYQTEKREKARKVEAIKAKVAAAVGDAAPVPAPARDTVRVATEDGIAASGRVTWEYEIVDQWQLPLNLLMPNRKAILAHLTGLRSQGLAVEKVIVPGLRVFEKVSTSWR